MFKHSIKNGIYSFYRKNILVYLLFGGHRPVSSQRSNFQLNVQQGSSLISDEYDKDRKHTSAKSYSLSTYPIPFSSEITFDFKLLMKFFTALLLLIQSLCLSAQRIIYVNQNVAGGQNLGNSWANAFSDLQDFVFVLG